MTRSSATPTPRTPEQPLRILQVIETGGPGGAETVYASLSQALADRGHMITCATADGTWLPDELHRRGLERVRLAFGGAFDRGLLTHLRRLIREREIDVVHGHLFDGSVYAAMAAWTCGVPCVVTLHGQVDVARAGWRAWLKRTLLARLGSRIITVSEALRQDLSVSFGSPADEFQVIHNGVSTTSIRTVHRGDRTPRAGRKQIIAVGNIRRPKGYPILLAAIAALRNRGLDVQLDIAGEPDGEGLYTALLAQRDALGLHDCVSFLGFVPDASERIAAADAFVLASTKEGFSLATVEAMLAGVPVVATRSGGPEEIIADGLTGRLAPIGDAQALAAALAAVWDEPAATQSMVGAALEHATRQFGLPTMVNRYESLYREVV